LVLAQDAAEMVASVDLKAGEPLAFRDRFGQERSGAALAGVVWGGGSLSLLM
jgi:hypothetical protein